VSVTLKRRVLIMSIGYYKINVYSLIIELFGGHEPNNFITFTDDLRVCIQLVCLLKRKIAPLRCALTFLCLISSYSAVFYLFVECRDHLAQPEKIKGRHLIA
jgi:hypothetical protein